jgi:hypothetical protein
VRFINLGRIVSGGLYTGLTIDTNAESYGSNAASTSASLSQTETTDMNNPSSLSKLLDLIRSECAAMQTHNTTAGSASPHILVVLDAVQPLIYAVGESAVLRFMASLVALTRPPESVSEGGCSSLYTPQVDKRSSSVCTTRILVFANEYEQALNPALTPHPLSVSYNNNHKNYISSNNTAAAAAFEHRDPLGAMFSLIMSVCSIDEWIAKMAAETAAKAGTAAVDDPSIYGNGSMPHLGLDRWQGVCRSVWRKKIVRTVTVMRWKQMRLEMEMLDHVIAASAEATEIKREAMKTGDVPLHDSKQLQHQQQQSNPKSVAAQEPFSTFNLSLTGEQRDARANVVLPYLEAQSRGMRYLIVHAFVIKQ